MARYLIKTTYESGSHKGESYLLRKGGYVTNEREFQWNDTTYATLGTALRECRRLKAENDLNYEIERKSNEYWIKRGFEGKEWFIYERESYEPYAVDEDMMV